MKHADEPLLFAWLGVLDSRPAEIVDTHTLILTPRSSLSLSVPFACGPASSMTVQRDTFVFRGLTIAASRFCCVGNSQLAQRYDSISSFILFDPRPACCPSRRNEPSGRSDSVPHQPICSLALSLPTVNISLFATAPGNRPAPAEAAGSALDSGMNPQVCGVMRTLFLVFGFSFVSMLILVEGKHGIADAAH